MLPAQEKILSPLRQIYRQDQSNQKRIARYVENYKQRGYFTDSEISLFVHRLKQYEIEYDHPIFSVPKLTVELVPKTCWYSNVRSHVSKKTWDILRKSAYKNASYLCEICGGKGPKHPVECHECWHYDEDEKTQLLLGLMALCPNCHIVKHLGLAFIEGKDDIAYEQLQHVNGWGFQKTEKYVEQVFEVWQLRSQHEWELDISWLKREHNIDVDPTR